MFSWLTKSSDRSSGEKALRMFFNHVNHHWHGLLPVDNAEDLIKYIDARNKSYIAGLGLGINVVEISDDRLNRAMIKLGDATQGKLPKSLQAFQMAVSAELQTTRWEDVVNVATSIAEDSINVVGGEAIDIAKSIKNDIRLYAIVGILGFIGIRSIPAVWDGFVTRSQKRKEKERKRSGY